MFGCFFALTFSAGSAATTADAANTNGQFPKTAANEKLNRRPQVCLDLGLRDSLKLVQKGDVDAAAVPAWARILDFANREAESAGSAHGSFGPPRMEPNDRLAVGWIRNANASRDSIQRDDSKSLLAR
jgi:hypothetical protein